MLENVGRKVFFVVLALAVALAFLLVKDPPFRLGLDLRGGTRLVYRLDFKGQGDKLSEEELRDPTQLLNETITIVRNRVDPKGVLEPVIRPEGSDRIVIELPGTFDVQGESIESTLQEPLPQGSDAPIRLEGGEVEAFPEGGGLVQIGDEVVRYLRRDGDRLFLELRGRAQRGTIDVDHPGGATVSLLSDDAIRARIESLGDLSFQIVANDSDFLGTGESTNLTLEREKLAAWVEQHPGLELTAFNQVSPAEGGPDPRIQWYPHKQPADAPPMSELERAAPLLAAQGEEQFLGSDLARAYPAQDQLGYPAVGFEFKIQRRSDFGRFTEKNENRSMAIVLNGEIVSAPNIEERLNGSGIIRGQFTPEEVRDLITVLRSGSLTIAPELEYEEVVGPTLGADYVQRGFLSGIGALVLVLAFMALYYRRLGLFSCVALIVNFVLLMGGLSFLDATVTLPGIAGVILTVGMAVDANILIFDRIREEADRGRNPKQAAKTGFEKALSAILDSNITSFLTAVILYRIGTGPVRGFAVTLMVGIITSVFCALVVTRLLVHWSLARRAAPFRVGTWMVTAAYDFLGKTKLAMGVSTLAVAGGVALFVVTPDQEKLGIDFTGGAEVHLRTDGPQTVETMRERVAALPAPIGPSAEVKPILSSADGDRYTDFRAIFKTLEEGGDFQGEIRAALADVLLKDGVQAETSGSGATRDVTVQLFFEEPHPTSDLEAALGRAGLTEVAVSQESRANAYRAQGKTSAGIGPAEIVAQVKSVFREAEDSGGNPYRLATPVPSSSVVGAQVVGELRNAAFLALAVSLFVIVMYIRVRFAEYSYGFAAVAALLHDVAVTLGALTLANHFGLINGEISLPMIAAFLTIVGYSLNDTIVIFDRVRENAPRSRGSFREVLNLSINQTLSRTVLTSGTTFLAVLCLFVFNYGTGNVLESFSFAMMIGILTGTYSTIWIANPVLLWLETRSGRARNGQAPKPQRATPAGSSV